MVNASHRQIYSTLVRTLLFLFCFLTLITTSTHRTEADTDAQAYEQPFISPEPRQQARLGLQVNHSEEVEASLGGMVSTEVIVENVGNAAATGVTLHLNGEQNFTSAYHTLGYLKPGESRSIPMTAQITGYTLGQTTLYFTANAENINNPVQESISFVFIAPEAKFNRRITSQDETLVAQLPEQLQVISEQIISETAQGGTVLRFHLIGDKNAAAPLHITLNDLLPAKEIISENLVLIYQTPEQETQLIPFIYEPSASRLTFTPVGTGEYILQFRQTGFMESGAPDDPSSWQPTFNEPVISLFNGSTSYNYPILIPPGPGGFQPSLGLAYNSAASNGAIDKIQSDWVGWGWHLTGEIEVTQAVKICEWGQWDLVCPVNAEWGSDDQAYPGILEFSLSIGGTGYDIIHVDGEAQNGYPGRYYVTGSAGIFVEYCLATATHTPSPACIAADNGDGNPNGSADEQQTHGFWLIKTPDNTSYRLGYRTHSEQELVAVETGSAGRMGPWSGTTPYAHALRWRVDKSWDRFDNAVEYFYAEYWPSEANSSWNNGLVHAPASYVAQIQYGYGHVRFNDATYDSTLQKYRFNTGVVTHYGPPPIGNDLSVISWQTHQLNVVDVEAQSYNNPNGTYSKVRSYALEHLKQRHGTDEDGGQHANQTDWCRLWDYDNLTNWDVNLLTAITEKDKNGNPVVINMPNVEFEYEFRRTGMIDFPEAGPYKYCYPYLTDIYTLYGPDTAPTASITYLPEGTVPFITGEERFANIVGERTFFSGWSNDAPPQIIQYAYPAGWDYDEDNEYILNGAFQAKQTFLDGATIRHALLTQFLIYNSNQPEAALNGRIDWQKTLDSAERVLAQQTNSWGLLDDYTTNDDLKQYVLIRNITQDFIYGTAARMDYSYDHYGNQIEAREFGDDLVESNPLRTQETLYLYNTNAADNVDSVWLINLAWQTTVWEGLPSANILLSRQRSRYDDATCTTPNALPTQGLLKYTDTYAPGSGTGICGNYWLTTSYAYGGSGGGAGLWWQPTRIVSPGGLWTNTHWLNHTLIASQQNAGGTTTYLFNDSNTPWLLTEKIAANGSHTHYTYDPFSRLTEIRTPDATTGAATVFSQQYIYHDDENPLYIDEITAPVSANPVTTRTFLDALGRPLQQRVWGMNSDVAMVVTDTEYNGLGQSTCQTAQLISAGQTFNSTLDCHVQEHTASIYNISGNTIASTGVDNVTSYQFPLGYATLSVNGNNQLGLSTSDDLGRLIQRDEMESTFNEPFDVFNSAEWTIFGGGSHNINNGVLTLNNTRGIHRPDYELIPSNDSHSIHFSFQVSHEESNSVLSLRTIWDTSIQDARYKWELVARLGRLDLQYRENGGEHQSHILIEAADFDPDTWYEAVLTMGNDGQFSAFVWERNNPAISGYFKHTMSPQAVGQAYHFLAQVPTAHSLRFDYFQEIIHRTTNYGYDLQDNLKTVHDALGNLITEITYNMLGQKTHMVDLDMGDWLYDYDYSGNLIRQTDGKGQRLCLYYDNLNRLDSKYRNSNGTANCPTSPAGTLLADYAYYSNGAGLGQLQSVTGTNNGVPFAESFTYDYRGRVTTHTRTIDNIPFTVTYQTYDILDRPTAIILPSGETVTTGYDGLYANSLQASGQTLVSNMVYNRFGQPTLIDRPAPIADTTFNYYGASDNYRLSGISSGSMQNLSYAYDTIGNILQIQNIASADIQEFQYDSLNRLTNAIGGSPYGCPVTCYNHSYAYDLTGNIDATTIDGVVTDYLYPADAPPTPTPTPAPIHGVTSSIRNGATVGSFVYDANGNMISRTDDTGTYSQTFDDENRLITINKIGGGVTQFAYDANGQRIKTVQPDGTVIYYPFPDYEVESGSSSWQDVPVSPLAGPTTTDSAGWAFGTSDNPGWYFETPANLTWSGTHVFTGTTTIAGSGETAHLLGNLANGYIQSPSMGVAPNTTYTLKAWIKGEIKQSAGLGKAEIQVGFTNGQGEAIEFLTIWSTEQYSNTTWQQVQGTFVPPTGMNQVIIRLRVDRVNGWISFDDLTLQDSEGGPVTIPDAGFELGGWTENPHMNYPATSIWRGNSGPAVAHGGQNSYVLSNLGHTNLTSPMFAITAGAWKIDIWVNGTLDAGTSAGDVRLEALYYDSLGILRRNDTVWSATSLTQGWQKVGANSNAPFGTTQMKLRLVSEFNNASVTFDDVTIVAGETSIPVPDGDFEAGNVWARSYHAEFPASVIWYGAGFSGSPEGDEAYTFTNMANGYLESSYITVQPNHQYELSALVSGELNNAAANNAIGMQVNVYNSQNTLIFSDLIWSTATYNTNIPIAQSDLFTTPGDAAYLRIQLFTSSSNGWAGFSDVTLTSQSALIASGPGQNYDLSAWVRGVMDAPTGQVSGRIQVKFFDSNSNPVGTPYTIWSTTDYNQTSGNGQLQSNSFTTPAGTAALRVYMQIHTAYGWLDMDDMTLKAWSAPITTNGLYNYDLSALVKGNVQAIQGEGGRIVVHYTGSPTSGTITLWSNPANYNSPNGTTQSSSFTLPTGSTSFRLAYEVRLDNGWLDFDDVLLTGWSNSMISSGNQAYQLSLLVSGVVTAPAGQGGRVLVAYTGGTPSPYTFWTSPINYNSSGGTTQTGQFTAPAGTTSLKIGYEIRLDNGWLGFSNVILQTSVPGPMTYRTHYLLGGRLIAQRLRQENNLAPLFQDNFDDGNAAGWTAHNGSWAVNMSTNGYVYRQSSNGSATNSSTTVSQSTMTSYSWQMKFNMGSRVGGLYFFASEPTDNNNHGYAYYVYQSSGHVNVCETSPGGMNCQNAAAPVTNGETHTYRVTYNPTTGRIDIWRDGTWLLSRTDSTPLTSGNHIAFRTQTSNIEFDKVRVTTYSDDLQYFFSDHLGSASVLSDSNGTAINNSRAYFLPFGDYRGTPPTADVTEIGFTGHHQNNDAGLIYMNARYYVPGIGRFASADTIVPDSTDPQSFNRYSYVHNSPLGYVDPSGHGRDCFPVSNCPAPTAPITPNEPVLKTDKADKVTSSPLKANTNDKVLFEQRFREVYKDASFQPGVAPVIVITAVEPILSFSVDTGPASFSDGVTISHHEWLIGAQITASGTLDDPSLTTESVLGPQLGFEGGNIGATLAPMVLVIGVDGVRLEGGMSASVGLVGATASIDYSGFTPDQIYFLQANTQLHHDLLYFEDIETFLASWGMLFDQIYALGFDPENQPYWSWDLMHPSEIELDPQ